MRKKTIAWLFIIGIVLAAIGGGVFGAGAASSVTVAADGTAAVTGFSGMAMAGLAIIVLGSILSFISWIGALVATGKQGRWGWFVCVLLLSGLGELIYLFAGPGLPANAAAVAA